jgi:hypothetical protein
MMKKLGVAAVIMVMCLSAYARGGGGGGGHGGGGHSSGHAGGEGHSSAHESVSESGHESVSTPRRTNPFIIIPHGSSTTAACPNGVASEVQGSASETAVSCYTDPEPKNSGAGNVVIASFVMLIIGGIVWFVLASVG